MDVQKLELLIKKINQTVKIIERLKENEIKYQAKIEEFKSENMKLHEENLSLKKEIDTLKEEINKNSIMHKELEEKILEIIKYLPDDDNLENSNNSSSRENENDIDLNTTKNKIDLENNSNIENDENEEVMLKNFVSNKTPSENSLFASNSEEIKTDENKVIENIVTVQQDVVLEKNAGDNDAYELKFGDMLFDNNEEDKDIEFNFDNTSQEINDDELPRGVL